jgi:DNA-binding NarL/FixJ family response regulator
VLQQEAFDYRNEDRLVMLNGVSNQTYTTATLPKQKLNLLTLKNALYDDNALIAGIMGVSYVIDDNSIRKQFNVMSNKDLQAIDGFKFTKREIDILRILVRGKTFKEIAHMLHLSARTVEHYVCKLKIKTDTFSKSDLIEKFFDCFK